MLMLRGWMRDGCGEAADSPQKNVAGADGKGRRRSVGRANAVEMADADADTKAGRCFVELTPARKAEEANN